MRLVSAYSRVGCAVALAAGLCAGGTARALDPQAGLAHYASQVWRTENGLPQNSVHQVLQTRDGYIWLATEGGLARFDGFNFVVFDKDSTPALPGNDICCLLEDAAGALWIGTASGVARLDRQGIQTFTATSGLPSDSVLALAATSDGAIWVRTAAGLGVIAGGKAKTFGRADGLPSDSVTAITTAADGTLWAATDAGLAHSDHQHVVSLPAALPSEPVTAMVASPDGSLLFATAQSGVQRLRNGAVATVLPRQALAAGGVRMLLENGTEIWAAGKDRVTVFSGNATRTFTAGKDGLPGNRILTLYADHEGSVWIGTDAGLGRYVSGTLSAFHSGELAASAVLSLYEDREKNLWAGGDAAGVTILRDQKFSTLAAAEGLSSDSTSAVFEAPDHSLWIGTSNSGLNRLPPAAGASPPARDVRQFSTRSGMVSDIVLALAASGHTLWIGTPDGLDSYDGSKFSAFTSADGLADDFVRSLLTARDGSLWIGTRRGLTHWTTPDPHHPPSAVTNFSHADGLGSDLVGALLEDRNGALWAGTFGGLSRITSRGITNFTTRDGLPGNIITALLEDARGNLWVGTNGGGLARWDGKTFTSYAQQPDLPRVIYAMLLDGNDNLWLSSDRGIHRVALSLLNNASKAPLSVVLYGPADGLRTREAAALGHPAAWRTEDGRLLFATLRGVSIVDPRHMVENTVPPPVVIERITVDDRTVSEQDFAAVAPGHTHFAFDYAGLSFAAPQKVRYRYRLEGFDPYWTDAGTRRTAFYTNIPPGNYRFVVQAANNDGVWNEAGAAVRFRLKPHFYQTRWFIAAAVLAVALLALLLYRLRVRRIQSHFNVIMGERNRIAREIHDTLAQGFVAVSVQLELIARLLSASQHDAARQQLDTTRALVRDGLADARRSIWDLRAEGKDAETLPARLTRTVEQLTASTPIQPQVKITGTYVPLAPALEGELLRISQEAVNNAIRHSGATTVSVSLIYDPRTLVLQVVDDGRGFDPRAAPAKAEGHFGLAGMQERAQQIRGKVVVDSAPGRGTRVRAEAPIAEAQVSRT